MKKIIALALIVACVFTLASCWWKKEEVENPVDLEALAAVQAKIDASSPETANITVTLDSELGELNGNYKVTYSMEDGSATVEYTYEKFNELVAGKDFKETVGPDTVTVSADGTLSEEVGGVSAVEALTFDLTLDADKLVSASLNAGVLTAKVQSAHTASVLGVAIDSDVDVLVTTTATGVSAIAIAYDTAEGRVEISATYTYYVAPEEEGEEGENAEGDETTEAGATE